MNPTEPCKFPPAVMEPRIDRNRCEGKGECVTACRYSVFTIGRIDAGIRAQLSFRGRLKALGHGGKQAFATQLDLCQGCGDCVRVCPEDAITLVRRG